MLSLEQLFSGSTSQPRELQTLEQLFAVSASNVPTEGNFEPNTAIKRPLT